MLSYLILDFLPFIKHDALSLSAKDDMRKWDEPLEPNIALCHSSQSPSSFQAYELAAKYTTVVNIYIFWHFQFSSPAISCECCNGWAAASRLVLQKFHPKVRNHGEGPPTMAFSWLKAATTAFTFKTLLRHYSKRALTPRSLNVKLGCDAIIIRDGRL